MPLLGLVPPQHLWIQIRLGQPHRLGDDGFKDQSWLYFLNDPIHLPTIILEHDPLMFETSQGRGRDLFRSKFKIDLLRSWLQNPVTDRAQLERVVVAAVKRVHDEQKQKINNEILRMMTTY